MIGERLRKARKAAGLAQVELAVAMGDRYNGQMISMVENNRSGLLMDGAVNAAKELEVSLDYLFGLTDDPTPAASRSSNHADGEYPVPEKNSLADTLIAVETTPPYEVNSDEDGPEETIEQLTEVAAAAGIGASAYDETVTAKVPFRSSWLRRNRINPRHCQIIGVRGASMEPTLPDGCSIIVDRNSGELQTGRIYVMRTEEGLVVKRVKQNAQGWWLMSDNPEWAPLFLTEETDIVGEVRWLARTF